MKHKRIKRTGGDRISALPEPILHQILSFLPNKDVKVTSSLSKTWYHISNSFPVLDFDFSLPVTLYFRYQSNSCFLNYVDETLHRFHNHNDLSLPIQRLNLTIPSTRTPPELLDSWISLILQNGIQDLNLSIKNRGDHRPNWYPVLAAKSIKVAKLAGCCLLRSFPNSHHISGSTSNLLKLCLEDVLLDDAIWSSIISTCPLIEDLAILSCIGAKCFQISNLRKLKTLRVEAPRLQGSVKVRVHECPKLLNLDLNRVVFEEFISGLSSNLLKLHLDNVVLDDLVLSSIISTCPLIEKLSIVNCKGIESFQICNLSKLKTLWIDHNSFATVEIVAPSLQFLQIEGPIKIRVIECPKLMELDLDQVEFEDLQLQDFLFRLSFIRHLTIANVSSLTRLKMSSNTLKKLTIFGCYNLVKLKIDAPNLCLLGSDHCSIASSSKQNVSYGTCKWYGYNSKVNPFTVEYFLAAVRNFVSNMSHSKNLSLLLQIIKPISFEELNKRTVQPVVNIDYLDLTLSLCEINDVSEISYPDILDCVLWSCHPRTLSLRFPSERKDILMSSYEVMGHRHRPHKVSRSWLHCLEKVTYVARDGSKGQLLINGISLPSLCVSCREIKFVFEW